MTIVEAQSILETDGLCVFVVADSSYLMIGTSVSEVSEIKMMNDVCMLFSQPDVRFLDDPSALEPNDWLLSYPTTGQSGQEVTGPPGELTEIVRRAYQRFRHEGIPLSTAFQKARTEFGR